MVFESLRATRRATILASVALLAGVGGLARLGDKAGATEADKPARGATSGSDLDGSHGESTRIDGFRQARFGMTEMQLRRAIELDFPAVGDRITRLTHPKERTLILGIAINDLLPDTGSARIFYILGFKSNALEQINIVWTSDGKTSKRDEAIVAAANSLRDYFLAEFKGASSIVVNRQIADNAIIVFRVERTDGRMLLMMINGIATTANSDQKSPTPLTLKISYIRDHLHPDIFHIDNGKF
jgi:hypothetical protein